MDATGATGSTGATGGTGAGETGATGAIGATGATGTAGAAPGQFIDGDFETGAGAGWDRGFNTVVAPAGQFFVSDGPDIGTEPDPIVPISGAYSMLGQFSNSGVVAGFSQVVDLTASSDVVLLFDVGIPLPTESLLDSVSVRLLIKDAASGVELINTSVFSGNLSAGLAPSRFGEFLTPAEGHFVTITILFSQFSGDGLGGGDWIAFDNFEIVPGD